MSATDDPIIRRRDDGSIDIDHYDHIARGQRASDQRAALGKLIAPVTWLLGAVRPELLRASRNGFPR